MMKKIKLVLSILLLPAFAYGAYYLYYLGNDIYFGDLMTQYIDYQMQLYLFGWIAWLLAGVCALTALYCLYYFLMSLIRHNY
ncbi:MAG: hypothetical protein IKG53_03440 [Solobacterium sp.]|nr:hypothetical protein [Solobacterium sp.]